MEDFYSSNTPFSWAPTQPSPPSFLHSFIPSSFLLLIPVAFEKLQFLQVVKKRRCCVSGQTSQPPIQGVSLSLCPSIRMCWKEVPLLKHEGVNHWLGDPLRTPPPLGHLVVPHCPSNCDRCPPSLLATRSWPGCTEEGVGLHPLSGQSRSLSHPERCDAVPSTWNWWARQGAQECCNLIE